MTGDVFDGTQLCAETDAHLFFDDTPEAVTTAKAVCRRCHLVDDCLTHILTFEQHHGPQDGVWGGTTPAGRNRIRLNTEGAVPA